MEVIIYRDFPIFIIVRRNTGTLFFPIYREKGKKRERERENKRKRKREFSGVNSPILKEFYRQ